MQISARQDTGGPRGGHLASARWAHRAGERSLNGQQDALGQRCSWRPGGMQRSCMIVERAPTECRQAVRSIDADSGEDPDRRREVHGQTRLDVGKGDEAREPAIAVVIGRAVDRDRIGCLIGFVVRAAPVPGRGVLPEEGVRGWRHKAAAHLLAHREEGEHERDEDDAERGHGGMNPRRAYVSARQRGSCVPGGPCNETRTSLPGLTYRADVETLGYHARRRARPGAGVARTSATGRPCAELHSDSPGSPPRR